MPSKNTIVAKNQQRVVIIGSGNLAWHLCAGISAIGTFEVIVVNHKTSPSLQKFKTKFGVKTFGDLKQMPPDADCYLICVPDKQIAKVASQLEIRKASAIVCHTSGSTGLQVLSSLAVDTAVFYPLQSFTAFEPVSWQDIPVLIETQSKTALQHLNNLALRLGAKPHAISEALRFKLHLAAVLVNNFSNALFVAAEDLVKEQFSLLLPLIRKTAEKAGSPGPRKAQTGPAKRGDKAVMKKHLQLLGDKKTKELYKLLSSFIQKQQNA